MGEKKHFVITIGRQYGSGGRVVGETLAKELGIHFYDEEILKMTSEKSAVGEQYFRLADEKAGNNLLYRIVSDMKPDLSEPSPDDNLTSPDNLFRFQAALIRKLAKEESCIFAGRCADYVLEQDHVENLIRIFVYADMDTRIQRAMDVAKIDEKEAVRRIKRIDKERKEYYRYYTGKDWMNMNNYDLPINASKIDLEQMAVLTKNYLKLKGLL